MHRWHDNFISLKMSKGVWFVLQIFQKSQPAMDPGFPDHSLGVVPPRWISHMLYHLKNFNLGAPEGVKWTSFVDSICNVLCCASFLLKHAEDKNDKKNTWTKIDVNSGGGPTFSGTKNKTNPHPIINVLFIWGSVNGKIHFWPVKKVSSIFTFDVLAEVLAPLESECKNSSTVYCMCFQLVIWPKHHTVYVYNCKVDMRFLCTFKLTQVCTGLLVCF